MRIPARQAGVTAAAVPLLPARALAMDLALRVSTAGLAVTTSRGPAMDGHYAMLDVPLDEHCLAAALLGCRLAAVTSRFVAAHGTTASWRQRSLSACGDGQSPGSPFSRLA